MQEGLSAHSFLDNNGRFEHFWILKKLCTNAINRRQEMWLEFIGRYTLCNDIAFFE